MSVVSSLGVKLAMLAASIGLVCWIGWPVAGESPRATVSGDAVTSLAGSLPTAGESHGGLLEGSTEIPVTAKTDTLRQTGGERATTGLLDLNRAAAKDLESLPGIGPVLAQRVIEYRTTVGEIQAIEDLLAVKGIGPKIFERLKPLVTVTVVEGKAEKRP